jgi:hypothetical protein
MNALYQIQVKYLDKIQKNSTVLSARGSQSKYLEKLVNQTPIGVYKKSELGKHACRFQCSVLVLKWSLKTNRRANAPVLLPESFGSDPVPPPVK